MGNRLNCVSGRNYVLCDRDKKEGGIKATHPNSNYVRGNKNLLHWKGDGEGCILLSQPVRATPLKNTFFLGNREDSNCDSFFSRNIWGASFSCVKRDSLGLYFSLAFFGN